MFAKLKEKTGSQRPPSHSNHDRSKLKAAADEHLKSISEAGSISDANSPYPVSNRQLSRQSSVSSLVSDMSLMSTSQFINESPMPNIDTDLGTFDLEDNAFPQLSSDLSTQDIYSSLVRESRQKLSNARTKYHDLIIAYRELEKQNTKLKDGLSKSQDRAFKKISELKETEKLSRAELDMCQRKLTALEEEKNQIISSETEVESLKNDIEHHNRVIRDLEEKNASAILNQDRISKLLTTAQFEKNKLEEGLKLASDKVTELRTQISDKETIHSLALAECKRSVHNILEERDLELKSIRRQLEISRKEIAEINSSLHKVRTENSSLQEKLEYTAKQNEAEKDAMVQEVRKAKDAAYDVLKDDFEQQIKIMRNQLEEEFNQKWQESERDFNSKHSGSLEESLKAKQAADSMHEEEIEVLHNRISQLSVELDSARVSLQRRTVEVDQLRSSQEQATLQTTADIEQAVIQCRRELESQHYAEVKKLRSEIQSESEHKVLEEREKVISNLRTEIQNTWNRFNFGFEMPEAIPDIFGVLTKRLSNLIIENGDIRNQVLNNRNTTENELSKLHDEVELLQKKNEACQQEITKLENDRSLFASHQENANEKLQLILKEKESRLLVLETINSEKSEHESDEVKSLHIALESLNKSLVTRNSEYQSLLDRFNQSKDELEKTKRGIEEAAQDCERKNQTIATLEGTCSTLDQLKTSNDSLVKELNCLKIEYSNVTASLEEKNVYCQRLKSELKEKSGLKALKDELESKFSEREKAISDLETKLLETEGNSTNEINKLKADVESKDSCLREKEEENSILLKRIEDISKELDLANNSNEDLNMRFSESSNSWESQLNQTLSDVESMKEAMKNAKETLAKLVPPNLSEFSEIVSFAAEAMLKTNASLEQVEKEKESLKQSLLIVQSELHQTESKLEFSTEQSTEQLAKLNADLDDANCKLRAEVDRSKSLQEEIKSTELASMAKIAQLEDVIQSFSDKNDHLSRELDVSKQNFEEEHAKCVQVAEHLEKLGDELQNLRNANENNSTSARHRETVLTEERSRLSEELKASTIEVRRLETKIITLESDIEVSKNANDVNEYRLKEEAGKTAKFVDDLKTKYASLEMELVECREKLGLSQELLGKVRIELDSSRKVTEESQHRFSALKTQSAKKLKLLGDEKCELEKQLATSFQEIDALKERIASADEKSDDFHSPSVEELQNIVEELRRQVEIVNRSLADKEIRIAELELDLSDKDSKHQVEIDRIEMEGEKMRSEVEQKVRFEMKRAINDFEHQLADRDRQITKLTTAESNRTSFIDPDRHMRSMERELSEKNAAVEQLVAMYEKQLRDQSAELRQDASSRIQSQNEKHRAEIEGLMEEFRNETKQWVLERQQMNLDVENARKERDQMVHELKRLSDLLDNSRGSPSSGHHFESQFLSPGVGNQQSSVMTGSMNSPGLNTGVAMQLHEATEYEYLRNILLEFMLGRETSILWRVIGTIMRFSEEQMNEIAARQDARNVALSIRYWAMQVFWLLGAFDLAFCYINACVVEKLYPSA